MVNIAVYMAISPCSVGLLILIMITRYAPGGVMGI
jgi:hypothetical protein